jgi:hypothetical protein
MLLGREIKDTLGATCSMYEGNKKCTQEIGCETSRWRPFCYLGGNAKVRIKEIHWEGIN